jgi:hypothetical protein
MLLPLVLMALRIGPDPAGATFRQPQLAADGHAIGITFGAGDSVYFAGSTDNGATFNKPVLVSTRGKLSLGMHRGPRIAMTPEAIVISAITGKKGRGADGDIIAWRSADGGRTWSEGVPVNDVPGSAREGLHAMAYGGSVLHSVWLDLRHEGTRIYGSQSRDGGRTWSKNMVVYESPSGSVCECCHPSVAVDSNGRATILFRNSVDGARDMYLVQAGSAERIGSRTWPLKACPMDGGGLALDGKGNPLTVWRRGTDIYSASNEHAEERIGSGKDAAIAVTRRGRYIAWTTPSGVQVLSPGRKEPVLLSAEGGYTQLLSLPSGQVLAAWEDKAGISLELLP